MLFMLLAMHWSGGSMTAMARVGAGAISGAGPSPVALVVGLLIVAQATWAVSGRLAGSRPAPVPVGTPAAPMPVGAVRDPVPVGASAVGAAAVGTAAVGTARAPGASTGGPPVPSFEPSAAAMAPLGVGLVGRAALAWQRAKTSQAALAPRCSAGCLLVMSVATAYMIATARL
jgi:hypothetical protein